MKPSFYFHTIRNLKWPQIRYRVPVLKEAGRPISREPLNESRVGELKKWVPSISAREFYSKEENTFTFLNQPHTFLNEIQWDFADYGLLWTYNLNYFEFLVQQDMDKETGCRLIDQFISRYDDIKIAHDPYPTSLRLIFWIRFFVRQRQKPVKKYLRALHRQAKELQGKLEYHLLGNHLLENAFALFISGCYLADISMLQSATRLLTKQLEEQILPDGGHFELSPMYHQLMLYRLLDCINVGRACSHLTGTISVLPFLEQTAAKMLGWMQQMTFKNGDFPLFNDAANGIAPDPAEIAAYAYRLNIPTIFLALKESGYRKWEGQNWELFMDVGRPGPSYQPGHAHCDALSFVLNVNGRSVIVDTGTSVYGGNPEQKQKERGTAAHNTVQIDGIEQSEIWGEFRMGRKANVTVVEDTDNRLKARHNGFFFNKWTHERSFLHDQNKITILDSVRTAGRRNVARFHFHPDVRLSAKTSSCFDFETGNISFQNTETINTFHYEYAPEFGKRVNAEGLEVAFTKDLRTEVMW